MLIHGVIYIHFFNRPFVGRVNVFTIQYLVKDGSKVLISHLIAQTSLL